MGRTACTEPQCLYKGALYLYLTLKSNNPKAINLCLWFHEKAEKYLSSRISQILTNKSQLRICFAPNVIQRK